MLTIGVEVTMILTLVGISYGTLDETARRARRVGADILVRPPASSIISLISSQMSEKLLPFLDDAAPCHICHGHDWSTSGGFEVLTGIDLAQFNRLSGRFRFFRVGAFKDDVDVIVDEYYAREKKLDIGSTITLANHAWRVEGIFESGKLSHICSRLNVLQELTGNPGRLSQIHVKVDDPARVQLIVAPLLQLKLFVRNRFTGSLVLELAVGRWEILARPSPETLERFSSKANAIFTVQPRYAGRIAVHDSQQRISRCLCA